MEFVGNSDAATSINPYLVTLQVSQLTQNVVASLLVMSISSKAITWLNIFFDWVHRESGVDSWLGSWLWINFNPNSFDYVVLLRN